jgi:TPR repeat protein
MHELEVDAERIPTPLPEFLRGDVVDTMRADALNYLGDCYFYGKNIEKDLNLAVKCYRRAAKSGSVWAKYSLGWCLLGGHGADKSPEEAVALFSSVSSKHPDAAYCLGRCYEEGVGVATSDLREALKYYKRAEKQGHAKATAKVSETEEKLRELAVSAK